MSDEADEVTVHQDDFGRNRILISVTHGQYTSSMNVTADEARRVRDAITEFLADHQIGGQS